jgi:hypothetical protein
VYTEIFSERILAEESRKLPLANSFRWFALTVKLTGVCNVSSARDNYSEEEVYWIATLFSLVNMRRRFRRTWSPLFNLKVVTVVPFDKYTRRHISMYFAVNLYFYRDY